MFKNDAPEVDFCIFLMWPGLDFFIESLKEIEHEEETAPKISHG